MDQRPKCKRKKLIQLPKETIRKKHDIGFGNGFLDMTPKSQATQEKIEKLNLAKIKNICASKDTIKRVNRQPTEWEKIFANHISDKELISRIYKELLKLN